MFRYDKSMNFTTITTTQRGLDGLIASDIARKIFSGQLTPGTVLPAEVDLCEQLGVSRTALREALKLVSSKGLLESRPKTGTRVRARSDWNILDVQLLEWLSGMEGTLEMYQHTAKWRKQTSLQACTVKMGSCSSRGVWRTTK